MKNARLDEYCIFMKTSTRKIAGLEKEPNYRIKVHEEAFKMQVQIVFKF